MTAIRHSADFPGKVNLLRRYAFKDGGPITVPGAPALTTLVRIIGTASGGQGADFGGNAAWATNKAACAPGEVLLGLVGQVGTAGPGGDSWIKRATTGEFLFYADRGHGSAGIQGDAGKCIGALARSGIVNVGAGSDLADLFGLGFAGRPATARRAPGPGGGGQGVAPGGSGTTRYPAGQGKIIIEFYSGDPGIGF